MLKTDIYKESSLALRDWLEKVLRHKNKALLFFLAVITSAVIALAFTPGKYTSTAKLLMRVGRENVFVDPTTSIGTMLPVYKEWTTEINSELEILKSRELMENVVVQIGLQTFFDAQEPQENGGRLSLIRNALEPVRDWMASLPKRFRGLQSASGNDETSQMNKAVRILEQDLKINVQERSDIIIVSYAAKSPELARQVVTLLIDRYLETRLDVRRTPGAYQFFTEQKEQLLAELRRTEKAIRSVKETAGVLSPEESRRTLQEATAAIQTQQMNNQSALAASSARVETLRAMLSQQGSADVKAQNSAIRDPEERREIQTELRREETAQAALLAEKMEIERQVAQLNAQLATIDAIEDPIRNLRREQTLLEEKYRQYSENQEQARINQALETEKISNVSIVQHATLPTEPDPSRKFFKLLAALFVGLLGAGAVAVGANSLDPTLHSAADISERLHLPTLIELPEFKKKELDSCALLGKEAVGGAMRTKTVANCFQELCFKILALRPDERSAPLVIGLTGSLAGEGVSTIAANLSAAFSRDDRFRNVMLLDANPDKLHFEWSGQTLPFAYSRVQDLAEAGSAETRSMSVTVAVDCLDRIKKQHYDIIVVDIPPVSGDGYAARVAAAMDVIILVARAGYAPWRTVLQSTELLTDVQASPSGIVLNRRRFAMPAWLYRKL